MFSSFTFEQTVRLTITSRRDGSPFMNLLMMAPLLDSRGNTRYFIGAQTDVSGLVKESTDLDAFAQMLAKKNGEGGGSGEVSDEFQDLCEMFNHAELDTIKRFGGSMHKEHVEEQDDASLYGAHRPRLLIKDPSSGDTEKAEMAPVKPEGRLSGVYKHVRIRILK